MQLSSFKTLIQRNKGILVDIVVFLVNLVLMQVLFMLSTSLVDRATNDSRLAFVVGLYFVVVLLIQPIGPILRRWSFHQRIKSTESDENALGGCLIIATVPFYLIMMIIVAAAGTDMIAESIFGQGETAGNVSVTSFLIGVVICIVNTVFIYRYFLQPKKPPRWDFLRTSLADSLGALSMFLNVILLQIMWNQVTASKEFWEILIGTPLGRAGSFTDYLGRFIVIGTIAMLVYIPPRMYFLVEDRNRKLTWLTMFAANLPLIIRVVLARQR